MDLFGSPAVALGASALGVASHLGYFIHGEHHMSSPAILGSFVLGPIVFYCGVLRLSENQSYTVAAKTTVVATISYFTALTLSIVAYRVFFHPLRNFPGPFGARISKLSHVFRVAKDSKNYLQADQLHKKYGDVVR